GRRRIPGDHLPVAGDAAHDLGGRRALPADVLEQVEERVFRRRRRQAGPGQLLLDSGPGGRRAQRGGPPHRDDGGGERAGGPSGGGGGGGGGKADELKGQAPAALVTLKGGK